MKAKETRKRKFEGRRWGGKLMQMNVLGREMGREEGEGKRMEMCGRKTRVREVKNKKV